MKWNFKRELARKFVHLLSLFILLIYFIIADAFNQKIALFVLVLVLIIFLELEYFRLDFGRRIPVLHRIWNYVRRKKEENKIGGDVFFLVGAILVLSIFNVKIAMAAILMTTFGDMAAALIGRRFGKHYIGFLKDRAWEGIIAEFVVDVLIGFFVFFQDFWTNFSVIYLWQIWIIILVMAITATIVETLIYKMDDNLMIPVFSGFNGQMTFLILSYFYSGFGI